jgi:hypothetical protein
MRSILLAIYCRLTNYRFRKLLKKGLRPYYPDLTVEAIRMKAGASLTSVSAFLAFVVAVLPLVASKEFDILFRLSSEEDLHHTIWCTALAFFLPYSSFWFERYISAVSVEFIDESVRKAKRFRRSSLLILSLAASVFLILGAPSLWPSWGELLKLAFLLAGAIMTVLSVAFFLFALEFYDSATGWRGDVGLHFHLASMASNSYLFGVSLALMGASLTVCAANFVIGRLLAACTLVVLIAMTEIERALWDLDTKETPTTSAST